MDLELWLRGFSSGLGLPEVEPLLWISEVFRQWITVARGV